jgi:hypothetical protein
MIEPEHKVTELEIKQAEYDLEEKSWRSCCFQLEPKSSLFFAQLTISIMTIGLCTYQLIMEIDCSSRSLFSSILSSVIAFWLARK